jgi:hypothetical protein
MTEREREGGGAHVLPTMTLTHFRSKKGEGGQRT